MISATIGKAFTVTVIVDVAEHPFTVTVYEITAVPADIPVTIPDTLTIAISGESDFHIPDGVEFDNAVVRPTHTEFVPEIGVTIGRGLTIMVVETIVTQPFSLVTS